MRESIRTIISNSRYQYIDALRGLAMFLVVFVHVEIFGFFEFSHFTFLGKLFSTIHMPIFFFISGFCIYRPDHVYGKSRLYNDILRLLIPPFIVGLLYTYFKLDKDIFFFLSNPMKAGYWFTMSLFEILIIYYIVSNFIKDNSRLFDLSLIFLALFLYLLKLPLKIVPQAELIANYLCLHQTFNFFMFFVVGIMFSKYRVQILKYISNKWVLTILLLLFSVLSYLLFFGITPLVSNVIIMQVIYTLCETVIGLLGLILLFVLFSTHKSNFSDASKVGKILILVGNNTLAIYLIHYFFIPFLPEIGEFLLEYPSVLCELSICLPVSFMIIIASICTAKLIRISPILGKVLLGDK